MDSRPLLPAHPSRNTFIAYIVISELAILWISYVSTNAIVEFADSDYLDLGSLRTTVVFLAAAIGVSASFVFGIYRSTVRGIAATAVCCSIAVFASLCVAFLFPVANKLLWLLSWPITSVAMGTLLLHPAKPLRIATLCLVCLMLQGLLAGLLFVAVGIVFEAPASSLLSLRLRIVTVRMMQLTLLWNGAILFFTVAKRKIVHHSSKQKTLPSPMP